MAFTFIVSPRSVTIEYEAGSPEEGLAPLMDPTTALGRFVHGHPDWDFTVSASVAPTPTTQETPQEVPAAKRGRKPRNQPDPATASAPPPMPVAPPAPPLATAPAPTPPAPPVPALATPPAPPAPPPVAGTDIPPFLQRTAPVVPILGPKIVAEYERRKAGSPDGGKGIQDWLYAALQQVPDLVIPGYSFDEALAVVPLAADAKLEKIAAALGIS